MAWGWFNKSTRTKVAKLANMAQVAYDMAVGDCIDELETAMVQCDRDWKHRTGMDRVAGRKPGEVFPVSIESCAKATAALRKCMRGKEALAKHIVAMDQGLEEDERRRREPDMEVELDHRCRWWTGMMKSEEELRAS